MSSAPLPMSLWVFWSRRMTVDWLAKELLQAEQSSKPWTRRFLSSSAVIIGLVWKSLHLEEVGVRTAL